MDTVTSVITTPTSPTKAPSSVSVRTITGANIVVPVDLNETVDQFSTRVAEQLGANVDLIFNGRLLTDGTLASNNIYDGARIDAAVSMKAGRNVLREAPISDAKLQSLVDHVASLLRPGTTTPVSLSFEHGDQTVTINVEPSTPAPQQPVTPPPSHASPMEVDDDEQREPSEAARRRMQELANAAQDEARATTKRNSEIKRTAATMASLQARMKAKKLARERKMHPNTPVPAPPPAPVFGGMKRGFLGGAAPKPAAPSVAVPAAPVAKPASTPAVPTQPTQPTQPATQPAEATQPAVPAKAPAAAPAPAARKPGTTFGGMRKGFLN